MSTWAENRRADRVADAEQRRAREAMVFEQRRADRVAAARLADERKAADAARRAATRAAVVSWVSAHTIELLFLPVVLVPAVLAWSAIAGFGHDLYGGPGWTLPLFSEAAMWAFAFAVAAARRAGRPVGRLLLGVWVSAGVSGTLAFLHGLTHPGGGIADGVVMALVAVGGVVVHQLVTAAPSRPRRTRAERDAARLERLAARRVVAVRRAALRQAAAEIAADGTATLVHRPGLVAPRRRFGRVRLAPTTVPGLPVTAADIDVADDVAAEFAEYLAALDGTTPTAPRTTDDTTGAHRADTLPDPATTQGAQGSGTAETDTAHGDPKITRYTVRVRAAIDGGRLPDAPSRSEVQRFLRCRAEHATAVHRALTRTTDTDPGDDDGPRQEVTA